MLEKWRDHITKRYEPNHPMIKTMGIIFGENVCAFHVVMFIGTAVTTCLKRIPAPIETSCNSFESTSKAPCGRQVYVLRTLMYSAYVSNWLFLFPGPECYILDQKIQNARGQPAHQPPSHSVDAAKTHLNIRASSIIFIPSGSVTDAGGRKVNSKNGVTQNSWKLLCSFGQLFRYKVVPLVWNRTQ